MFVSDAYLYENDELGVRFEIDGRFAPGPRLEAPDDLAGDVRSAYLATAVPEGAQAVLSISRVEVGYEMSPQELAEQLVIHNRYAALTAQREGWTIHRPWEPTTVGGHLAMRDDYVVPDAPSDGAEADAGDSGRSGGAAAGDDIRGEEATGPRDQSPGHMQGYIVYVGGCTYQLILGVHPPGDLDANRRVMAQVVGSLEFDEPG